MKRLPALLTLITHLLLVTVAGGGPATAAGQEPGLVRLATVAPADASAASQPQTAEPAASEPVPAADEATADNAPTDSTSEPAGTGNGVADLPSRLLPGAGLAGPLSAAITIGVVSIAPAALLMTTCYVRFSVVLSLVRQGLGTQGMPSNQIVASLALFLSAMVMWPVWTEAWRAGVEPYQAGQTDLVTAVDEGSLPVRRWMAHQIEAAGNRDTVLMFLQRHPTAATGVASYDDVPAEALLPAFLVSELETAFALGVRLLIPFLLIDLIVATLVVSTGLVMLPPTVVSLPLKLLVFVMADGWTLVVTSLLDGVSSAGM